MSYNITRWHTKQCSLRVDVEPLIEDEGDWTVTNERSKAVRVVSEWCESGTLLGTYLDTSGNEVLEVGSVEWSGSGSGHSLDSLLELLRNSEGTLEAVLVWEGGDSIERLRVENGVVTRSAVSLDSL